MPSFANLTALILASGCVLDPGAAVARAETREREAVPETFTAIYADREADRATAQLRPDLREKWIDYLRGRNLDDALDRATTERLKDAYFEAIEAWGNAGESCEPDGVNRRWVPRLLKDFTKADVLAHRDEIARVLGALAADRLSECAQPAEERALRAERELNAFVGERLHVLFAFFDGLEPGTVRVSTRHRLARLEKGLHEQRPLADRSVSIGALRLKTAAGQADPRFVEHLEGDPSFQKPFALGRALAQLKAINSASSQAPNSTTGDPISSSVQPLRLPALHSKTLPDALAVPWLLQ